MQAQNLPLEDPSRLVRPAAHAARVRPGALEKHQGRESPAETQKKGSTSLPESGQWGRKQAPAGAHLGPHTPGKHTSIIKIDECRFDGEESAILAMAMNPAAEHVDLIDLGLPDDAWQLFQDGSPL